MVTVDKKIPDPIRESINHLDEDITVEMKHYAYKADMAITVQKGETVLLVTVTVGDDPIDANFVPLSIEFIEKYYAGGVISGSRFVKRETRPSDEATLVARQVDHSVRSLIPKSWRRSISLVMTVLSYDEENDPEELSVFGASTALMLSSVPFFGPAANVKLGITRDEEFIWDPSVIQEEEEDLQLSFVHSVREDRILNIEGWADQTDEELVIKGMEEAVEKAQPLLKFQEELAEKYGNEKLEYAETAAPMEIIERVKKEYSDQVKEALLNKDTRSEKMSEMKDELYDKLMEEADVDSLSDEERENLPSKDDVDEALKYVARKIMRSMVLDNGERTSGRGLNEIRPLRSEVGVLPRVHGSSVFTRGMTQSLTILTLGSTRLAKTSETYAGEEIKTFMHHYTSPNYSFGDAGRFSYYPGRREIGHGHIGENGLKKVLPSEEEFPYTIRLSSEIMSSNGSTSMAATCASTLALLDGGVPIKAPVAGVALGLVTNDDDMSDYKLLVDMEDVEDFYGDMDFKVTGTKKGVTAIQLDNKLKGVPTDILAAAFKKSKEARAEILDHMEEAIAQPNQLSQYAPKVETIKIDPEKISMLIGPGGKVIKGILAALEDKVEIDIQDDGQVHVMSVDAELQEKAKEMINMAIGNIEPGRVFEAEVDKIADYGIFVQINESLGGLVHVSELSDDYMEADDISKKYTVGDKVQVKFLGYDDQDRTKLSIKQINDSNGRD
jgi:polyribonucleotide nucleotidyltransferase